MRYKVQDIIKTVRPEFLRLKAQKPSSESPAAAQILENRLNLRLASLSAKATKRQHRPLWSRTTKPHVETIRSSKNKQQFHLIPERNSRTDRSQRYTSAMRIGGFGLLIIFMVNLANIFAAGLDFRGHLIGQAAEGLESLQSAVSQADQLKLSEAAGEFEKAQQTFEQTKEQLSFLQTGNQLATSKSVSSANAMLQAGLEVSRAGQLFAESGQDLINWPELFIQANRDALLKQKPTEGQPSLTARLNQDLQKVSQAIDHLQTAQGLLKEVDLNTLPANYREKFAPLSSKLDSILALLTEQREHFPAILKLLGDRYPHSYLILLQNDTEARPTGGFIGSLLLVDINDGLITKAEFKDVYSYDGQLSESIPAPEDISQITDNWRLRDSNYSPDFAISAEKAAWFLQKSKGPSVETVIAINQSLIADLIAELGPLKIPELKSDLTSTNFQFLLSYLIETKYYGAENPKLILSKTIDAFKEKLLHTDNPKGLLRSLIAGLSQQKILFYSRDTQIQKLFEDFHLTPHPQIPGNQEDYLQVIATSIGGNKSDLFMSQDLSHKAYVDGEGNIYDELTITREHHFTDADLDRWNKLLRKFELPTLSDDMASLLGRGDNLANLKIYLPFGSQLLESSSSPGAKAPAISVRHDPELKKTYFLTQMRTQAGDISSVTIRYKLPFQLKLLPADIYHLIVDKQIGLVPDRFAHQTILNPLLTILRSSFPENPQLTTLPNTLEGMQVIAK